eukprot:6486372-Amphidinium_carterae.1
MPRILHALSNFLRTENIICEQISKPNDWNNTTTLETNAKQAPYSKAPPRISHGVDQETALLESLDPWDFPRLATSLLLQGICD